MKPIDVVMRNLVSQATKTMSHGKHIKVLGMGMASLLNDPAQVKDFLNELVRRLGMRPLGAPIIYAVELEIAKMGKEPFEDEGGVTGTVVLSTSHCAIHTWPARHFFVLDCYSCRDFDAAIVDECLRKYFVTHHCRIQDLSYSLEWDH